ncbi:MAG: Putative polyhydroxyalkanoic acid system protein (PHA_gran_rgn), partial [uncultured Lysobacter sp.]
VAHRHPPRSFDGPGKRAARGAGPRRNTRKPFRRGVRVERRHPQLRAQWHRRTHRAVSNRIACQRAPGLPPIGHEGLDRRRDPARAVRALRL